MVHPLLAWGLLGGTGWHWVPRVRVGLGAGTLLGQQHLPQHSGSGLGEPPLPLAKCCALL